MCMRDARAGRWPPGDTSLPGMSIGNRHRACHAPEAMVERKSSTPELLEAWREASRAAELAAELATHASQVASRADDTSAAAEEIAKLAEQSAKAAERAASTARTAAKRAAELARTSRANQVSGGDIVVAARAAEDVARGRVPRPASIELADHIPRAIGSEPAPSSRVGFTQTRNDGEMVFAMSDLQRRCSWRPTVGSERPRPDTGGSGGCRRCGSSRRGVACEEARVNESAPTLADRGASASPGLARVQPALCCGRRTCLRNLLTSAVQSPATALVTSL